jgi:hypothetical protein
METGLKNPVFSLLYIKRVRIVSFFAENCFPHHRHCGERNDKAIQKVVDFWIASSLRSPQ